VSNIDMAILVDLLPIVLRDFLKVHLPVNALSPGYPPANGSGQHRFYSGFQINDKRKISPLTVGQPSSYQQAINSL